MLNVLIVINSNKTMSFKVIDKKTVKKVHQNIGKSQQFNEYRT